MPEAKSNEKELADKVAILQRHVDHLMGQLYHQVDLIQFQKDRADHLERELQVLRKLPEQLDAAVTRVTNLRETLAGRKEVEMDLRRRIEELEFEEKVKTSHILMLEKMLHKIWSRPDYRFMRGVRQLLGRRNPVQPSLVKSNSNPDVPEGDGK